MFTLVFLVDDENGVYGYPESCAHNIASQLIYANGAAILDPIDVAIMQGLNVIRHLKTTTDLIVLQKCQEIHKILFD